MDDKLREAFYQYVQTATSRLHGAVNPGDSSSLLEHSGLELRHLVNGLEREPDFSRLSAKTLDDETLDRIWFSSMREGIFRDEAETSVGCAAGNFFRRSECYVKLFEGQPLDIESLYKAYVTAFRNTQVQTRYLAPIALVDFGVQSLSLPGFQICKFSAEELGVILNSRLNNVFYPLAAADVNQLEDYWFLDVTETHVPVPIRSALEEPLDLDCSPSIRKEFLQFPAPVDTGIGLLALWDWDTWSKYGFESPKYRKKQKHEWEPGKGWTRVDVPFVLAISSDPLSAPSRIPEIQPVPYIPQFHPETGEEVGDAPMYDLQPSDDEVLRFGESLGDIGNVLTRLRAQQNEWPFLEIGLGFFIKAFFSEGLQQLLSHITVLEALFGENKPGLTNLLGTRIAAVLGNSNDERKSIKKAFQELYEFRCNLVHGNAKLLSQQVYVGHLRDARDLARRCLLWFLHCLDHILTEVTKSASTRVLPSREGILSVIDLNEGAKQLVESLPTEFPSISPWSTL